MEPQDGSDETGTKQNCSDSSSVKSGRERKRDGAFLRSAHSSSPVPDREKLRLDEWMDGKKETHC